LRRPCLTVQRCRLGFSGSWEERTGAECVLLSRNTLFHCIELPNPRELVPKMSAAAQLIVTRSLPSLRKCDHYSDFLAGFGRNHQDAPILTNSEIQIGCRTYVPRLCASIPVMNGATAPPELPTDAIRDRDEICIFRGMSRWNMCTAQG
jgi:hypothetical protein